LARLRSDAGVGPEQGLYWLKSCSGHPGIQSVVGDFLFAENPFNVARVIYGCR
jgi:hypothetical protein